MFKNLDGECFGIVGRQNEVIEFALSNGFAGISVDFSDLKNRVVASGVEFATRYLVSAKSLKIGVGSLRIRLGGTDEEFSSDVESLQTVFEIVDEIRKTESADENRIERATITIEPGSDTDAYHENFEKQRARISQVADKLAEKSIKLGLALKAHPSKRENKEFEFIHQAEGLVSLIGAVTNTNVGLDLNTWDWLVGGGALDQLGELGAEKIVSVTLSDLPENSDLTSISNSDRLMPGFGDSDFTRKVVTWLHEQGYNGPITPGPASSQFSGSSRDSVIHKVSNRLDEFLVEVGAIEPVVAEIPAEPEEAPAESEPKAGEEASEKVAT